jgi:chorismate dehydratase
MSLVKVSVVSYLNSEPFIKGISGSAVSKRIILSLDNPSDCAKKVVSGEVDLGLVPVVTILKVANAKTISSYCIGTNGPVRSVILAGNVPVNKMDSILLDSESNTSVALTRILAAELWGVSPRWLDAAPGYESQINNNTGGVIIGDRALQLASNYKYVYDLSEEWKKLTGLPFVFAVWLANKSLDDSFIYEFENALKLGVDSINDYCKNLVTGSNIINACDYLNNNISYELDFLKTKGLSLFLEKYHTMVEEKMLT